MRARLLAVAVVIAVVVVAALLVLGPSHARTYHLVFENAGQLVKGDQVQIGGIAAGTVKAIGLTPRDQADKYGTALNAKPTAAENQQADPEVRGLSGAKSLNQAYTYIPSALRYSAQVGQALTGTRPDDLSRAIGSLGRIGRALDRHEVELGDLVDNFDHALAGTARVAPALATMLRRLTPTLAHARATFADLDAAFPPTRALARELLPGVRATPATLRAVQPWLPQARGLLSRRELGGLAAALQPTSADLARLTRATEAFLPRLDDLDRCVSRVILPTGDVK
jgi:phospholipid/cholesterol/gamma-HCH transport system substrate-binding protein